MTVEYAPLAFRESSLVVQEFAEDVGRTGDVRVAGGRTQWSVGRRSRGDAMRADDMRADDVRTDDMRAEDQRAEDPARELLAPDGVVDVQPAELIVRVGAGTPIGDLDAALAEAGLQCPLDPTNVAATVGGTLSVGASGVRRLRHGHIRDFALEILYVSADGVLRRAGAPVVKNVTGFDLPRLLVGSIGTLGLMAEVVLRCGPLPSQRQWLVAHGVDPWTVRRCLFRPSSILWDGTSTYVHLEGTGAEVAAERQSLPAAPWSSCEAPILPSGRAALEPAALQRLRSEDSATVFGVAPEHGWIAEIGIGVVHGITVSPPTLAPPVLALNRRLKDAFDPTGRLNPGVLPW